MSRYDQKQGEKYGVCEKCGVNLGTEGEADVHMQETSAASASRRSHTVRITNPTREMRIQSMVDDVVQDAIEEALDTLRDAQSRGDVSSDEITEALKWHSDFSNEWERS